MRYLTLVILFALLPVHAADTGLAGRFSGDWKSTAAGASGTFRMSLEPAPGGGWKCEVSFTFGDQEVKTRMQEVRVDQSKVEAAYYFELLGSTLRSRIEGKWSGKSFDGVYHTTAVDGGAAVDEGTWTAARAK